MFRPFADWLADTSLSKMIQEQQWVVPTSQSIHLVALSVVFVSALLINLRLLGIAIQGRSISQVTASLVPWMWRGLGFLVCTGVIQTIAEPVRQFVTPAFWAKMIMIVVVVTMTVVFARVVRRNSLVWDTVSPRPRSARVFALMSTALWLAIIVCGRFIGYTWTFYA
jgi:hypothetical protein